MVGRGLQKPAGWVMGVRSGCRGLMDGYLVFGVNDCGDGCFDTV